MRWRWSNPDYHSDSDHTPNADSNTYVATQPYSNPKADCCYCEDRSGGYNRYETAITPSTASSLTRSWVAHAVGGISSEPVVVDGTIYWGSWDGYEHATSVDGRARWSTFFGKVSNPQCYPPTAGVASTATVMPIMIKGVQTLVDFVGGGDASTYALNALHW